MAWFPHGCYAAPTPQSPAVPSQAVARPSVLLGVSSPPALSPGLDGLSLTRLVRMGGKRALPGTLEMAICGDPNPEVGTAAHTQPTHWGRGPQPTSSPGDVRGAPAQTLMSGGSTLGAAGRLGVPWPRPPHPRPPETLELEVTKEPIQSVFLAHLCPHPRHPLGPFLVPPARAHLLC